MKQKHELLPANFVKRRLRRAFAVWVFQKMEEEDDWMSNLSWTNEAYFTCWRSVTFHNYRIWTTENPGTFVQTPFHNEKVTGWWGFTSPVVIGLLFFEKIRHSVFETVSVTSGQQTGKVNIGWKKNESIIYISKPMRKFMYTEEFFFKIGHINITKQRRKWTSHSQAFNLGIKNTMENKGCLPNTQMNLIENFLNFNRKVMEFT